MRTGFPEVDGFARVVDIAGTPFSDHGSHAAVKSPDPGELGFGVRRPTMSRSISYEAMRNFPHSGTVQIQ